MDARLSRPSMTTERPLPPAARGTLVFAAAVAMLAFYAAAVVSMALLATLLAVLAIVAFGAARFGFAGFVTPLMEPPSKLLRIFARKLWLPSEIQYRITLKPEDAPRLFELVADLARRMAVEPPATIVVEMHNGAWVQLKGFRRASGNATLGIGFDLLAGLSVAELEAVLAHELAHARLVQRGFSRWLNKGLARLAAVSREISEYSLERKGADARSHLADAGAKLFDALTIRAARLVATYSRQDEFEADRGAADSCGASAIRSALIKLEALDDATGRLPWGERVARLQPGENFSQWLVTELARLAQIEDEEPVRHAADPYSTHPTLRDRISALPADDRAIGRGGTGVELLAEPDTVAERLVTEIQRVTLVQERRSNKIIARSTKKLAKRESSNVWEAVGVIAIALGVIIGLIVGTGDLALDGIVTSVVLVAAGIASYRAGRYRDKRMLPIPAYGTLTPKPFESQEQLAAAEKKLYEELEAEAQEHRKKRHRLADLIEISYAALGARDYLRAHVAARLALQIEEKSVEASLAYAIAAAALGSAEQMQRGLMMVKNQAGFTSPATRWGVAWALSMLNDVMCEGFLQQSRDREPGVATYAALLAWAQFSYGKLHSAIENARAASAIEPGNDAITQLLIHALLQAGRASEAAERAVSLARTARSDPHTAFLMVRIKLMTRDLPAAQEWAAVLRGLDIDGEWLIALGSAFANARLDEPAGTFFSDALATSYTPHANIGLSVLATIGGDRQRARQHLLAALKLEQKKLAGGRSPAAHFHEVVARLNGLEERRVACKAWIAAIPPDLKSPLSGASLYVFAQNEAKAKEHLMEIALAVRTDDAPFDPSIVQWSEAPRDQQPLRPVQPGVQGVVS